MTKVIINENRCSEVIQKLNFYFQNKAAMADIKYPSNIVYKTNEYYIYMFYSCLLDYAMRSKIYHENLCNTYSKYPEIFEPKCVQSLGEDTLKEILVKNIHPRYPNIALKKWLKLSNTLCSYPSILDTLKNLNSFNELKLFIDNLHCYGQKTAGLLIRIISDSNICNFKEEIKLIPIDRHDMEISYKAGITNSLNLNKKDIEMLSSTFVKLGIEKNINPSDIDKWLWEIGSNYCTKKDCQNCPLYIYCHKNKEE